ncbi:hypothetical protein IP83_01585 [Novosphingobium sp. AAP93]|nr:hypothetical protein IP83_01585 [Novosphingobium sp. AAP93]
MAARRVGEALIEEHGLNATRALLAANAGRLRGLDACTMRGMAAAEFRMRRTLTADGLLLSEIEAAWCLRHALEGSVK